MDRTESVRLTRRLQNAIAPLMDGNSSGCLQLAAQLQRRTLEARSVSPDRSRRLIGTDDLAAVLTINPVHSVSLCMLLGPSTVETTARRSLSDDPFHGAKVRRERQAYLLTTL